VSVFWSYKFVNLAFKVCDVNVQRYLPHPVFINLILILMKLLHSIVNLHLQSVFSVLLFHLLDKQFLLHHCLRLDDWIPLVVTDLHFFSRLSASSYPRKTNALASAESAVPAHMGRLFQITT